MVFRFGVNNWGLIKFKIVVFPLPEVPVNNTLNGDLNEKSILNLFSGVIEYTTSFMCISSIDEVYSPLLSCSASIKFFSPLKYFKNGFLKSLVVFILFNE
ncbi:Uncharacterised protein [Streptococcus pneumoniae]|nr:Uncharacterised protein [Streptococcus pneumoniae]